MPYISPEERVIIEHQLQPLAETIKTAGQLNYAITRLVMEFFQQAGANYNVIALVTGVLSNVSTELYRRVFSIYENKKIEQNGDIEGLK